MGWVKTRSVQAKGHLLKSAIWRRAPEATSSWNSGIGSWFISRYIYTLYAPRIQDWRLLFSTGKGTRAALEGATREQGGSTEGVLSDREGARGGSAGTQQGGIYRRLFRPSARASLISSQSPRLCRFWYLW